MIVEGAAANQGVLLRCARRGERGEPKDPAAQLAACSAAGRWRAGGVRGGDAALLVVFAPPPSSARGGVRQGSPSRAVLFGRKNIAPSDPAGGRRFPPWSWSRPLPLQCGRRAGHEGQGSAGQRRAAQGKGVDPRRCPWPHSGSAATRLDGQAQTALQGTGRHPPASNLTPSCCPAHLRPSRVSGACHDLPARYGSAYHSRNRHSASPLSVPAAAAHPDPLQPGTRRSPITRLLGPVIIVLSFPKTLPSQPAAACTTTTKPFPKDPPRTASPSCRCLF